MHKAHYVVCPEDSLKELSLWDIGALPPPYYICEVANLYGSEHVDVDRKKLPDFVFYSQKQNSRS